MHGEPALKFIKPVGKEQSFQGCADVTTFIFMFHSVVFTPSSDLPLGSCVSCVSRRGSKVSSVTDAVVGSSPPRVLAGPDGPASTLGRPEVWVRGPESPIPVSGNDGSSL